MVNNEYDTQHKSALNINLSAKRLKLESEREIAKRLLDNEISKTLIDIKSSNCVI